MARFLKRLRGRFWKNFVQYSEYKRNSRADLSKSLRKSQENLKNFWIDWRKHEKKKIEEILGDFKEHWMNYE